MYNIPNDIIKRHFGTYMTSDTNLYTITSLWKQLCLMAAKTRR